LKKDDAIEAEVEEEDEDDMSIGTCTALSITNFLDSSLYRGTRFFFLRVVVLYIITEVDFVRLAG
jgi:uncharacterized membrane protein